MRREFRFQSKYKRIICFSILVLGSIISGLVLQYTPQTQLNDPRPLCCYSTSGYGHYYWNYSAIGASYEWQINPQPWVANYIKYDIDPQGMNCSFLFLKITMTNESYGTFIQPFIGLVDSYSYSNLSTIPLHYNASRHEYVALFNLKPYWGAGYVNLQIIFRRQYPGGFSFDSHSPYTYSRYTTRYPTIPYVLILPLIGILCIMLIEGYVRVTQRTRQKNRNNQRLLDIIQKQNPSTYEQALLGLDHDRNDFFVQTRVKSGVISIKYWQDQPNFCPYCGAPARFIDGKCGNCGENLDDWLRKDSH